MIQLILKTSYFPSLRKLSSDYYAIGAKDRISVEWQRPAIASPDTVARYRRLEEDLEEV